MTKVKILIRKRAIETHAIERLPGLAEDLVFHKQRAEHQIGFVADRAYEHYVKQRSLDETAQIIATASGKLGTCLDYLRSILENLDKCGITDEPLQKLLAVAEHKLGRDV